MTRQLTLLSDQHFSVCCLAEGWQKLRSDECQALEIEPQTLGWVREVLLCGRGAPWVFARSVASAEQLEGSGMDLQQLGSRPLGELLFCEPSFQRGPMHACRYPASWLPTSFNQANLWARRSCFKREALGILVAEVFLPALWQCLDQAPLDPQD